MKNEKERKTEKDPEFHFHNDIHELAQKGECTLYRDRVRSSAKEINWSQALGRLSPRSRYWQAVDGI